MPSAVHPHHLSIAAERLGSSVILIGLSLVIGLALHRVVDRYLEPDDPRRFLIAQLVMYVGLFVLLGFALLRVYPRQA